MTNKRNYQHGHSRRGNKTREFSTWTSMTSRCRSKSDLHYPDYGGRGIKVCAEWLSFPNFLADMGKKPKGMTLDRIDNDEGYSKENCRWTTTKEQNNNRRTNVKITFNGLKLNITQWARKTNMNTTTLGYRLRSGWSVKRALTTKSRTYGQG